MTGLSPAVSPLARKALIPGGITLITVIMGVVGSFTLIRLDDARRALLDNGQLLAESLAPRLEYPLVSGNTAALEQILARSVRNSRADWVRVTDVSGTTLAQAPPGAGSRDDFTFTAGILQQPLNIGPHAASQWFAPDFSFMPGALRLGTVTVGIHRHTLNEAQRPILLAALISACLLLTLAGLLMRLFYLRFLVPLEQIPEQIDRLVRGDYETPPPRPPGRAWRGISRIETGLDELTRHLHTAEADTRRQIHTLESTSSRTESDYENKSRFLAAMNLELRTPLDTIMQALEFVREAPLSARQQTYLNTARDAGEDLRMLIRNILQCARAGEDYATPEHTEFDLRRLIVSCAASYRIPAEQQGLTLGLMFYGSWPEHCRVHGDAGRLRQVIASLLGNAIISNHHGSVDLQASLIPLEDERVLLSCSVTDSGCGIPPEAMAGTPAVLPEHSDADTGRDCTPLNLPLVQHLVELMGGHIHLEEESGCRACLRFELPLQTIQTG